MRCTYRRKLLAMVEMDFVFHFWLNFSIVIVSSLVVRSLQIRTRIKQKQTKTIICLFWSRCNFDSVWEQNRYQLSGGECLCSAPLQLTQGTSTSKWRKRNYQRKLNFRVHRLIWMKLRVSCQLARYTIRPPIIHRLIVFSLIKWKKSLRSWFV